MSVDPLALFVWVLGLCVGSFLNVVIYRLPRNLSVSTPRWSFCPTCNRTLSWFENLPLLSWLLQVGRCRGCREPISPQYPLVEAGTGLAFVLAYHFLFLADARGDLPPLHMPTDAALLLAWLILVAALVASSALDIVSYMVDTRVTDLAALGGIICLAFWPRANVTTEISPAWSAAAIVALLISAARLYLGPGHAEPDAEEPTIEPPPPPRESGYCLGVLFMLGLLTATAVGIAVRGHLPADTPATTSVLGWVGIGLLVLVIVVACSPSRSADDELHEQIEEESAGARRMVAGELLWLLPAILAATVAGLAVAYLPAVESAWHAALGWSPGGLRPVAGVGYAMHGAVVGAAAGWVVRIGFTLALGREAFGVGDIYILAAAGACAGWQIALLGFLFAVAVALLLWLLLLISKPTAMIAFGPPLAIGFLVALAAHRPASGVVGGLAEDIAATWQQSPLRVAILAGTLLIATALTLGLARWFRHVFEGPGDG